MKRTALFCSLIILALVAGCAGTNVKPAEEPAVCEFLMRNTAKACAEVEVWKVDVDNKDVAKERAYKFKLKGTSHLKKGELLDSKKIALFEGQDYVVCISFCRGEGKKPFVRCQSFRVEHGTCKKMDEAGVKYQMYVDIEDPGE